MFPVLQNVGDFGIAAAILTRLSKANLDIMVAVSVDLDWGQTKSAFQFAGRSGVIFGIRSYYSGEVSLHLL